MINLEKLEKDIDNLLESETNESLLEWFKNHDANEPFFDISSLCKYSHLPFVEKLHIACFITPFRQTVGSISGTLARRLRALKIPFVSIEFRSATDILEPNFINDTCAVIPYSRFRRNPYFKPRKKYTERCFLCYNL